MGVTLSHSRLLLSSSSLFYCHQHTHSQCGECFSSNTHIRRIILVYFCFQHCSFDCRDRQTIYLIHFLSVFLFDQLYSKERTRWSSSNVCVCVYTCIILKNKLRLKCSKSIVIGLFNVKC
jgi:hypothetical protein